MNDLSQKKLIIYIGLAVLIFGVGTLMTYLFLFRGVNPAPTPEPGETVGEGVSGFPEAGAGIGKDPRYGSGTLQEGSNTEIPISSGITTRIFPVSDTPTLSLELSKKEDKVYYFKKEGGELDAYSFPSGTQETISTISILGLFNSAWSPSRDRAAVSYLDGDVVKSFIYRSIGTSSVATLPSGILNAAWSPSGASIAYVTEVNGETIVTTADSAGKNQQVLLRSPLRRARVSWPVADRFVLETYPSGLVPGYLFSSVRGSGELRRFLGPQNGLTSLWSPAGSRVLVAATDKNGKSLSLGVYDSTAKEIWALDFQTLPEKCVWASESVIYCGVPRGIPQEATLPDDYLRGELNTNDRIVTADLKTKTVTGIFNEGGYDISNLRAAKDGTYLFFIDRITGKAWGVEVTK